MATYSKTNPNRPRLSTMRFVNDSQHRTRGTLGQRSGGGCPRTCMVSPPSSAMRRHSAAGITVSRPEPLRLKVKVAACEAGTGAIGPDATVAPKHALTLPKGPVITSP
eukprot:1188198-Prorocentrum_minimum.AAC.2